MNKKDWRPIESVPLHTLVDTCVGGTPSRWLDIRPLIKRGGDWIHGDYSTYFGDEPTHWIPRTSNRNFEAEMRTQRWLDRVLGLVKLDDSATYPTVMSPCQMVDQMEEKLNNDTND